MTVTDDGGSVSTRRTVRELGDLSGRRVLVTGGAGHVGRVVAETMVEGGAAVVLCDLPDAGLDEAAASVGGIALPCDLRDEAETRRAVSCSADALGGLDVLVHCAALVGTSDLNGWAVPFSEQSLAAWDAAFRVNLTAAFVLSQQAAPALRAAARGSIIFFSSIYGVVGPVPSLYEGTTMATPVAYGASKAALLQLVRSLAVELAPDVRVNAISPGGIARGQPDEFVARYVDRTPLRRLATEEDVKGAVAFLASDMSAYVTGHNLVVDGGWTAW
jgi:NAD(P)-dependent dehydrogenase (short-subunit alcohol dehydrogenase family)